MKDRFSLQSGTYAQYRPVYPTELVEYLASLCRQKDQVWDCGTGNGQLAIELAKHFREVIATDISTRQLSEAKGLHNVRYKIESADKCSAADQTFDLITAAQAAHWFRIDAFYKEVERTLKPGGVLAIIGYNLPTFGDESDVWLRYFYEFVVGPYWDPERVHIDNEYRELPFPYEEISVPAFQIRCKWTAKQFAGYLKSWSATFRYLQQEQENPVDLHLHELKATWGAHAEKDVSFPVFMRIGRKQTSSL